MNLSFDRIVIDQEPKHLLFTSEPYVVHLRTGLTVAADVIVGTNSQNKTEKSILLSSQTLSDGLVARMKENNSKLAGVEVWVYKAGPEKTSKYIVED